MARREGGTLFYIVTDHLGTPKEALTETGHLVWSVDHSTWGTLRIPRRVVGDEDYWLGETEGDLPNHTPAPEADFCPIRFQGQWEDAETGLYYNRFRYYEPGVGQYVSPDPSQIWGGFSVTGYVEIPSGFVDVNGLRGARVTPGGPSSCADFILELSRSVYPETAGHIADAITAGQPNKITLDRSGPVSQRRRHSTGPYKENRCCAHDLDEWPMEMASEGGFGASVKSILKSDNRGAGSSIGSALRSAGVRDGQTVCFIIVP